MVAVKYWQVRACPVKVRVNQIRAGTVACAGRDFGLWHPEVVAIACVTRRELVAPDDQAPRGETHEFSILFPGSPKCPPAPRSHVAG